MNRTSIYKHKYKMVEKNNIRYKYGGNDLIMILIIIDATNFLSLYYN